MKTYTYEDYMKQKLKKKSEFISEEIFIKIKNWLKEKNIDSKNVTPEIIRESMKKLNLHKYLPEWKIIYINMVDQTIINLNEECCICYEKFDNFIQLSCKHYFCDRCLYKISNNEVLICPLCRNEQSYRSSLFITPEMMKKIIDYFHIHKDLYLIDESDLDKPKYKP